MQRPAKAVLFLALVAAGFAGGSWYTRRTLLPVSAGAAGRILYYRCPMHPRYTSGRPGDSPCCGMRLEPVYDARGPAPDRPASPGLARRAIHMSPEKQQLIGVRTAAAEKRAALYTIRAPGRVTADQNRVYRLNVSMDLWIRKLYPPTPGSMVRKNDPLLEFYTPNFYSAAAAYMYALNTRDRTMNADPNNTAQLGALNYQMRQAIESLQNLGVSDPEIKQMERTRQAPDLVTLRSPTDGYILTRTVEWAGADRQRNYLPDCRPGACLGVRGCVRQRRRVHPARAVCYRALSRPDV